MNWSFKDDTKETKHIFRNTDCLYRNYPATISVFWNLFVRPRKKGVVW